MISQENVITSVFTLALLLVIYFPAYFLVAMISLKIERTALWTGKRFIAATVPIPTLFVAMTAILATTEALIQTISFVFIIALLALYSYTQVAKIERDFMPGRHVHQNLAVHHFTSAIAFTCCLASSAAASLFYMSDESSAPFSTLIGIVVFLITTAIFHTSLRNGVEKSYKKIQPLKENLND